MKKKMKKSGTSGLFTIIIVFMSIGAYLLIVMGIENGMTTMSVLILTVAYITTLFHQKNYLNFQEKLNKERKKERAEDLEREEKREARRLREREEDIKREEKYREEDRAERERNARKSNERFEKITRESNERFERLIKEMRRSRYKSCGDF